MSKQRYLLIFALLLTFTLPAQSSLTLNTDLGVETRVSGPGWTGVNQLFWNRQISAIWELRLASSLNATDLRTGGNPQKIWHNGELALTAKSGGWELGAGYRNLAFGASELLGLYPGWQPLVSQERLFQHQASLTAAYAAPFLMVETHAQLKYLRYKPWELDLETYELLPRPNAGISDLYYGLGIQTPRRQGISANLSADRHSALYTGIYGLDQFRGGLNGEYQLGRSAHLSGSLDWTYRAGDAIPLQKRHLLTSTVRWQQNLSPDLAASVRYVNNACLDAHQPALLLVSDQLRAQLMYSLPGDPSGGSYFLGGGKFSPANSAHALFVETDLRLWKTLYAGGGLNFQPGRQLSFTGNLSYFYTPFNAVRLLYIHRANEILGYSTDYLGLGSSLHW